MKKLLISCLVLLLLAPQMVLAGSLTNYQVPAKAAIAVDSKTGKILYEKNADEPLPVGSLSRLLTLYMVYDSIKTGRAGWDDMVTISDEAYQLSLDTSIPNVPLVQDQYTIKDLTKANLIAASSSASLALTQHLAGSEEAALKKQQQLLTDWGLTEARLINTSGIALDHLGDSSDSNLTENTLSARDLASISHHLLRDFPEILELSEASRGTVGGEPIHTYNYLLENMPYARLNGYGLITGTSDQSGSSLISLSYENRMEVLLILIDVDGGREDSDQRFKLAHEVLDKIADDFHLQRVIPASTSFKNTKAPVLDGKQDTVSAVTLDDFYVVTTPDTVDKVNLRAEFPKNTNFAPIKEGQVVGHITFDDQVLIGEGYLGDLPSMPLTAEESVERANLFQVMWNSFVRYVIEHL